MSKHNVQSQNNIHVTVATEMSTAKNNTHKYMQTSFAKGLPNAQCFTRANIHCVVKGNKTRTSRHYHHHAHHHHVIAKFQGQRGKGMRVITKAVEKRRRQEMRRERTERETSKQNNACMKWHTQCREREYHRVNATNTRMYNNAQYRQSRWISSTSSMQQPPLNAMNKTILRNKE